MLKSSVAMKLLLANNSFFWSCLRRGRDEAEFSNQSIFSSMEKFVNAVQDMEETILVPCRLMDLKVGDATDSVPPPAEPKPHFKPGVKAVRRAEGFRDAMPNADLYNLYTLVNSVKNELQWGMKECPVDEGIDSPSITPVSSATHIKGHQRRPSNVSVSSSTSSSSSSSSDADSDAGNENDSGFDTEASPKPECTQQVAQNFRRHLHGLYRSLEQMTEAATYLTARYQKDVGDHV